MTEPATRSAVADAVARQFVTEFGEPPAGVFFAPGRLNLVGAHLDYNGGDVLPLAVDLGVCVAARLTDAPRLRLRSRDDSRAVDVESAAVGERKDAAWGWAGYPIGVWRHFCTATGATCGLDAVFGGDLPIASGMSSSAAIEIATATALDELTGAGLAPRALAELAHAAETRFVGVQCGIMDQFASALGRRGHVLLLHCHDASYEHVPIDPTEFEVLVLNTNKPRTLATSGFNRRVAECREALEILRRHVRELPFLAAYETADLAAAGPALHGAPAKRARHVVTEMERVRLGVASLRRGEIRGLGAALDGSHRSAAEDYEVSCRELDVITDLAREHDAVFGARLTGAGFGGCAVALIEPGSSDAVTAYVAPRYREACGIDADFMVLHPGEGPRRL